MPPIIESEKLLIAFRCAFELVMYLSYRLPISITNELLMQMMKGSGTFRTLFFATVGDWDAKNIPLNLH